MRVVSVCCSGRTLRLTPPFSSNVQQKTLRPIQEPHRAMQDSEQRSSVQSSSLKHPRRHVPPNRRAYIQPIQKQIAAHIQFLAPPSRLHKFQFILLDLPFNGLEAAPQHRDLGQPRAGTGDVRAQHLDIICEHAAGVPPARDADVKLLLIDRRQRTRRRDDQHFNPNSRVRIACRIERNFPFSPTT